MVNPGKRKTRAEKKNRGKKKVPKKKGLLGRCKSVWRELKWVWEL